MKQVLCPFDPQIARWINYELLVYRFNYLWADPNNVAYATTSLSLFYIIEEKKSVIRKYIVLLCLAYILLCTMSLGGIAVAFVFFTIITLFSNVFRRNKSDFFIGTIAILMIVVFVSYNFEFFYDLFNSGILKRHEVYGSIGTAGGGGRVEDFLRGVQKFNPLFLIVGSGQEGFVTEIGHIYLICLYGLPVYIYFMYVLFKKKHNQTLFEYITILPLFIGFTMNIAIVEQKFLLITILISAYYSAKYGKLLVLDKCS